MPGAGAVEPEAEGDSAADGGAYGLSAMAFLRQISAFPSKMGQNVALLISPSLPQVNKKATEMKFLTSLSEEWPGLRAITRTGAKTLPFSPAERIIPPWT
jgi:hypothetical protein